MLSKFIYHSKVRSLSSLLALGLVLGMCGPVKAQNESVEKESEDESHDSPLEITLAAGVRYDDRVTVEELDRTTDVDDFAAVLDFDVKYRKRFEHRTELRVGYSLSQKTYYQESDFDLQVHNLKFNLKRQFRDFDIGLQNYNVLARLDNDELLSFQHVSPYLTTFLTRKLYLRASYFYRNKDFPDNPDRDGHVNAGDFDLYFFIDGTRSYMVTGLLYENENTRAAEFDFEGRQFSLMYSRRLDVYGDRPMRVRLDWRYENRDYQSITPSLGERRDDRRQRWRARVDLPVNDTLTLLLTYQHRSHESNLTSADFDDNRFEAQIEAVF